MRLRQGAKIGIIAGVIPGSLLCRSYKAGAAAKAPKLGWCDVVRGLTVPVATSRRRSGDGFDLFLTPWWLWSEMCWTWTWTFFQC